MALICPSIERLMAMAKRCALVKIGKGRRKTGAIACVLAVWARQYRHDQFCFLGPHPDRRR
ncbi:hypothetical protein, partial [uncultured Nevskia sp.]|uniref:hypothetical protein n=1 Tax=uncultured Nevskia sp. TaxID=228950 RepID=UPI0025DAE0E0